MCASVSLCVMYFLNTGVLYSFACPIAIFVVFLKKNFSLVLFFDRFFSVMFEFKLDIRVYLSRSRSEFD